MKFIKQIVRRNIAGQSLLIPVGDLTGEYNGVFTLSDSADVIVTAIEEGLDEDAITLRVIDAFEIDEETAKNDVASFIASLKQFGLVE